MLLGQLGEHLGGQVALVARAGAVGAHPLAQVERDVVLLGRQAAQHRRVHGSGKEALHVEVAEGIALQRGRLHLSHQMVTQRNVIL